MKTLTVSAARHPLAATAALLLASLVAAAAAPAQTPPAPAAPPPAASLALDSISAGADHACGLTSQHVAWCWGNNAAGQLGNPAVTAACVGASDPCSDKPVRVATSLLFASISAGDGYTCAVTIAGAAYCWGDNTYGQLGTGSQQAAARPTRVVAEGVAFRAISAADTHTCAVATTGVAYCWGSNDGGKLGIGRSGGGSTVPVAVVGRLLFRSVTAGYFHTCGVTRAGRAYCWGRDDDGQAGDQPAAGSTTPVAVASDTAFAGVEAAAQFDYTCGVDAGGGIWCWGANCYNQLGVDSLAEQCGTPPMPCSSKPARLRAAGPFRTVSVHFSHSCAVATDGAAFCWGDDNNGQLGIGTMGDRSVTPAPVVGGQTWRALAVGHEFTCGITAAGATSCWGANDHGQLGIGAGGLRMQPTPLAAP